LAGASSVENNFYTMKNFTKTRDIVYHTLSHIKGKTVDLGAGNAKYKKILKPQTTEYLTFDIISGPNIDVVGDILNLPFPENSFDTIVSTQVLEHVTKPWIMVKEIYRVLKPGGKIILSAPFLIPYHADPYDYFRYTKEGMAGLFKDTGFEVIECDKYGGFFSVLSEMFHFALLDPYKAKNKTRFKLSLMRMVESVASFLDSVFPTKVIYSNVYIVAQKK
jgi:SAM-dependent methyltransferase